MSIDQKQCIPCHEGAERMSETQVRARLPEIPGWELIDSGRKLRRNYAFKNWKQAFAFVSKVNDLAEAEQHHPDIAFGWGYCTLTLQTHAIDGLHENDIILAAKIGSLSANNAH